MKKYLQWIPVFLLFLGCHSNPSALYQGYVEGDYVSVSPSAGGEIIELLVDKGDTVTLGQLLYVLDYTYEKAAVEKAEALLAAARSTLADALRGKRPEEIEVIRAQLAQAEAQKRYSAAQLARDEAQYKSGTITKAKYDQSRAIADSDAAVVLQLQHTLQVALLPAREDLIRVYTAEVEAAQAALAQARWNLDQKSVYAPSGGLVTDLNYRKGERASAGAAVIRILPPENIKVRFFVPQEAVAGLSAGQNVWIRSGSAAYPAVISFISNQAEYTPPVIYSNTTKSKLIFMMEAKPLNPEKFHPGQPVGVSGS